MHWYEVIILVSSVVLVPLGTIVGGVAAYREGTFENTAITNALAATGGAILGGLVGGLLAMAWPIGILGGIAFVVAYLAGVRK